MITPRARFISKMTQRLCLGLEILYWPGAQVDPVFVRYLTRLRRDIQQAEGMSDQQWEDVGDASTRTGYVMWIQQKVVQVKSQDDQIEEQLSELRRISEEMQASAEESEVFIKQARAIIRVMDARLEDFRRQHPEVCDDVSVKGDDRVH